MSKIVPVLIVLILVAIIGVPGAVASKSGVQEGLAAKIISGVSKESSVPCATSANCFTMPIVFCNIPSICIPCNIPCNIPKPCITPTPVITPVVTTPMVTPTATALETEVTPTATATALETEVTPTVTMTATPTVTQTPGAGPVSVPEFPSIALPTAAVMGLMMLLFYRRRDE